MAYARRTKNTSKSQSESNCVNQARRSGPPREVYCSYPFTCDDVLHIPKEVVDAIVALGQRARWRNQSRNMSEDHGVVKLDSVFVPGALALYPGQQGGDVQPLGALPENAEVLVLWDTVSRTLELGADR